MKILIDAVGIRGHGGARLLIDLLENFSILKPDWKWYVFLLNEKNREFNDPKPMKNIAIEITNYGNNSISRLYWIYYLLPKKISNLQPDIIISYANIGLYKSSIPQVVYLHQPNIFNIKFQFFNFYKLLRLKLLKYLIFLSLKKTSSIIVQTKSMFNNIIDQDYNLKNKVFILPSGYSQINNKDKISFELKNKIKNISYPKIIYITHPGDQKNHINLIKSLLYLKKHYQNISLLLTLENNIYPNIIYKRLVKKYIFLSKKLNVYDNIIWLGILNKSEVYYTLRNSDIMVFPSFSESFGLPLVEAMNAGCPIVAADLPYAHDVCNNSAIYFDPYNPEDMANKIICVLKNEDTKKQLLYNAKIIKDKYSYEKIAKSFIEIINDTLNLN